MKKKLSIFGCTGSIGDTTLKLLNKKNKEYSFYILSGYKNYKKIKYLIKKYNPKFFVIFDNYTFKKIKKENLSLFKDFLLKKSAKKIYQPRVINSLYFENKNFDMFHDSIEGLTPRKKIRVKK